MGTTSAATLDLQEIYEKWSKQDKKRTPAFLSRKSKVSYRDVRRTLQGEIQPSFKNIAPMLETLTTPLLALAYYEKHFTVEAQAMKKVFKKALTASGNNSSFASDAFKEAISDPYTFQVLAYLACAQETPVKKSYFTSQLGEAGEAILQSLIDEEIVKELPDDMVMLDSEIIIQDNSVLCDLISKTVQLMTAINRMSAVIAYKSGSLGSIEKTLKILKNAEDQINEVFSQPDSDGNIPIAFCMALGRIGKEFV